MKRHFIFAVLFLLACTKPNKAQEPRWELFARNLAGVIAVDPANSDVIYISPGEPGMWKTTDRGQSWNLYRNGWGLGQTLDILIDPINPAEIWASGSPFVGILKSSNGGQNWFRADTGLVPDHHGYLVWSLALDNQRRIFYAAHDGIFGGVLRSIDGVHWQLTNPNLPFCPLKLIVDEFTDVLYAGTGNGVWKSSDAGKTWTRISNGLPFQSPTPPVTYPSIWHIAKVKNSRTLYCAVSNRGIYKAFDSGENWFSVNDSITAKLSFRGGLVVAEKDTNTIYAGAIATLEPTQPGGIYLSQNGGNSWKLYNFGLPDSALDIHVFNMFLDNRTNVLYASIGLLYGESRGETNLYRLRDAAITTVHEPRHRRYPAQPGISSYPNPFNNQTIFLYAVHRTGQVILHLFDVLGKEVATLLDEEHGPGEYSLSWNGANAEGKRLPSGIYIARLQLEGEVTTIKVLLLQ
ncbi:T9SS type A sorting domain-containing protein [candidate division KSB1 bacterium]|nr:T9SS type A sorting domain-containing protein [candidate division KSB1 bacterium]